MRRRNRNSPDIRRIRLANSSASISTAADARRYPPIMPMTSAAEIAGRAPFGSRGTDGQPIVHLVAASTQTARYAELCGWMTIIQVRSAA
jgi:hypothetical protein